jgi:hypothetical protein
MTVAAAVGYPQYGGASRTFIPEIWSTKLAVKYYEGSVLQQIANTDYEGEIKQQGDKVNIRTIPDITINDYEKGGTLTYENPESPLVELLIDRAKYWAMAIDDIDAYQSDLQLMDDWAADAGEKMKAVLDKDVLGSIYADVDAANAGATAGAISESYDLGGTGAPITLTTANIIDYIVHLGSVLDEQSVPETGRWLVLPSVLANRVKRSEIKDASLAGDGTSILRNGRMGMIDRFTVYRSNHVAWVTDGLDKPFHVMAGHKSALTFAMQITKTQHIVGESSFEEKVRGLSVYGFKVVNGKGLAHLYAKAG